MAMVHVKIVILKFLSHSWSDREEIEQKSHRGESVLCKKSSDEENSRHIIKKALLLNQSSSLG
jgi:hypothetical protein